MHHHHGLNPQWATIPTAVHDRGLHRGVGHSFKRRRGLWPPISQEARCRCSACSHHNPTVEGGHFGHPVFDDGSTTGAGTVAAKSPVLRATSHSSGGATSACLRLATQHRAGDGAEMKQAHRQVDDSRGPVARATEVQAYTQGGEDPDGGLHRHLSSGQGSDSLCPP
jgi:hypothetical protein